MKTTTARTPEKLEDLPNIGKRIAADLRKIGITRPAELHRQPSLDVFHRLGPVMGHRHDPCVLYTLLAVEHFQTRGEVLPWWNFTTAGKKLLEKA